MIAWIVRNWRGLMLWTLGLFAGGGVLALLVAYSGVISLAASTGHTPWVDWLLKMGKERSVKFNSKPIDPPELNLAELVPLGAAHFQGTCAICHGTPGRPINPIFGHMLPPPTDLQKHARFWTREQLFWIARHGIQLTGMPAWSGKGRDDEVWAVAAFLEALPAMTETEYRRYAGGHSPDQNYSPQKFVNEGRPRLDLTACSRCHDTADAEPTSHYIPRIGGQDEAYLKRALHEYRDDSRQSGFMEPVADDLNDEQIERLATYYASLIPVIQKRSPSVSSAEQELGRQLAEHGDRTRKIPACLSCHGANGRTDFPRLAGQSEQYIEQQLRLLRRGVRDETPHGAMMTVVAKRLTEQQILAAAGFFASQPWQSGSQSEETLRR